MKKTVVLGVTSGIAAYRTLDLVKQLRKERIEVIVIMTKHAAEMVSQEEFKKTSNHEVYTDLFEKGFDYKKVLESRAVNHIKVADRTDVFVIAPATANTIAKLANGIADDFLTTTALAVTAPIIVCPSMNVHMWDNPAVQENITILKKRGFDFVMPVSGMLACGYEGMGRLAEIKDIKQEIMNQLDRSQSLKGKTIIVTAGGTMEKIDDVRYITNRGSGKMGAAIAEECYLRGAEVIFLRSKNAVQPRYIMTEQTFISAADLFALVKRYVKKCDVFFHTAAVSDFSVSDRFRGKIKSDKPVTLILQPTVKIIDQIKKLNPKTELIAFKAEYGLPEKELIRVARQKLQQTHADAIVANDISGNDRGFESDMNEVFVVSPDGMNMHFGPAPKQEIAKKIVSVTT